MQLYHYPFYGGYIGSWVELPPLGKTVYRDHAGAVVRVRLPYKDECLLNDDLPVGLTVYTGEKLTALYPHERGTPGQCVIQFYWRTAGRFEVHIHLHRSYSEQIVFRPAPQPTPDIAPHIIVYHLLPTLMLTREQNFALHASAVMLQGDQQNQQTWRGIAITGRSGAGKSTLAAALNARGHRLLADDTAYVYLQRLDDVFELEGVLYDLKLKLNDDSLRALDVDPASVPQVHPAEMKRLYRPGHTHFSAPLSGLYLLDDDDAPAPAVEPLSKQQAFAAFVAASYNAHLQRIFGVDVLAELGHTKRFLESCAKLAQHVPVRRLKRPRDLSRLNEVVDCLEADAKTL